MEKKVYSEAEIEELAEKAAKGAMEHFKHGLTCAECVFKGFLDLGLTDFPPEVVALSSGFGGGMGGTKHTCGAINGGMLAIATMQGRKNPYALPTFEERVEELHKEETGVYPRHGAYVKACITEWGTLDCRDLCIPYDESTPEGTKERARNCKQIIGFCAREATKAALKP